MLHEVHVWELVRDEYCYIKTWRLVDANPAALKSWGLALPEIVGKITDEIFPNSNATELFLPVIKKIFAEDTAHTWDNCFPDTNQFLHMVSIPFGEYFTSIVDQCRNWPPLAHQGERYLFLFKPTLGYGFEGL